jgi:ERCC4-type nuclease
MDHQQMNNFLTNVFLNGYKKGAEQAEGLNPEQTKEAIMSVKGIGEKKAADIMEALIKADEERKRLTNGE